MQKYLALLRGINVGGNKKVEMKKLKTAFEEAGLTNVRTYINSGNVLFESGEKNIDKLSLLLKKILKKTFAFEIDLLICEQKILQKLVKIIPVEWVNDSEQKTDVLFLWKEFDNKKSLKLLEPVSEVDNLVYTPGVIVWHIKRADYNKSAMHKFIGSTLYKNMTARNVNTVRKLLQLTV